MQSSDTKNVQYPNHITLEWLKQNEQPLYVRNMLRPRGQLAINFPSPNGRVRVIKIPRTHLPVNLSNQLSWDTIMMSDDLRSCFV